jgi:hypothetical protein
MPMSDPTETLWRLLDAAPDEDAIADTMTDLPDMDARLGIFLETVHGADRAYTPEERSLARDLILESMAETLFQNQEVFFSDAHETEPAQEADNPIFSLLIDGTALKPDEQRSWFQDPRIQQDFFHFEDKLKLRRPHANLNFPVAIAAASTVALNDRVFQGGSLRLREASNPQQIFIILQFEDPAVRANPPTALLIKGPEHQLVQLELSRPDADGKIILIKDLTSKPDRLLIELLRNPLSVGEFLA